MAIFVKGDNLNLRNKRLLIGSIIAIPIGFILWVIVGPVIAQAGISSHFEGWWIFGSNVTDISTTYWVGVGLSLVGEIIVIIGGVGIFLALVLEGLDKSNKPMTTSTQAVVYCATCGTANSPEASFCSKCGTKIKKP